MSDRFDLKATINLPRTPFSMKANLPETEPKRLAWWGKMGIYGALRSQRSGAQRFFLHDGPPYANNNIHLGQALNKILKDTVVKSRSMRGYDVPYVPGWDCHGLPIEHRVDLDLGEAGRTLPALEKRRLCREYAERFIGIQREEFRRLGVFWDWDLDEREEREKLADRRAIYRTLDREYEAVIVECLGTFFASGSVYHGRKPVHWCFSCQTALAEAEVEYEERNDPSIYVKFPLSEEVFERLPALRSVAPEAPVSVVIWTTTPWTLPANLALAFHPDAVYAALRPRTGSEGEREVFIVADARREATAEACGWSDPEVLLRFRGRELAYAPEEIAAAGRGPDEGASGDAKESGEAGPTASHAAGAERGAVGTTPPRAAVTEGSAVGPTPLHPAAPARGVPGRLVTAAGPYALSPRGTPARGGSVALGTLPGRAQLILADYVTLDQGTGCVHTAPGHGADDFHSGQRYGLSSFNPVADDGRFDPALVEPQFLKGVHVLDANREIVEDLRRRGLLLRTERIQHAYPHCWRCHNPVLFRATPQWFISMDTHGLRNRSLDAIRAVRWTPPAGEERIFNMIEGRPDWCISRQRTWGVPIPAVVCSPCFDERGDETAFLRDPSFFAHVAALFRREGSDAWFGRPDGRGSHLPYEGPRERAERLVPPGLACPHCGSREGLRAQEQIVDVWFESGVSHEAVLPARGLPSPADLYVEGHDQYRGWFHSSLLVGVGRQRGAPYRGVLTHGFTLYLNAKTGRVEKMSKSLGNVISPLEVCEHLGADILRLWVAQVDFLEDMNVSPEILERNAEAYRKIRNTFRFLLGNLYDFDAGRDSVAPERLVEIDRWALAELEAVSALILRAYDAYEFHRTFHALNEFCAVAMSATYLDIIKDRLYTAPARSEARRSAQTALSRIADALCRLMAPILPFTSEEVWQELRALPGGDAGRPASVHLATFTATMPAGPADRAASGRSAGEVAPPALEAADRSLRERWKRLFEIRGEVQKAIEEKRRTKEIGSSLGAAIVLTAEPDLRQFLESFGEDLRFLFIVSAVGFDQFREGAYVSEKLPGFAVRVVPASGSKCERCWNVTEDVGADPAWPTACARCARSLATILSEKA